MTTPMPLMELTSGVYAFKVLALADRLGVFTELSGEKSTTVAEFAAQHGIAGRSAELLLTACTSLGLLDLADGRYRNSAVSEEYLVEGKPYYFGSWVKVVDDPATQETFWGGMYSPSSYTATRLATMFDFGPILRLLDVGGGGGAFAIELCKAYPHLCATVFDLPVVRDVTVERIRAAGLANRIEFTSGDFFEDALPGGHDTMLLSNILHDWGEDDVRRILAACADALVTSGHLLICESFVDEKAGSCLAALMSLTMLVEAWGRNYTVAEYSGWLREAGLTVIGLRRFDAPGANGVLIARKP